MRSVPIILLLLLAVGCQTRALRQPASVAPAGPVSMAPPTHQPQYVLRGDIPQPGPRALSASQTLSRAVRESLCNLPKSQVTTVVLVRRCPEGTSRELIDLDPALRPVNPRQDYVLRDGDELILPSQLPGPQGLQRPNVLRISAAH